MGRRKKVENLEEKNLAGFDAERANSAVCRRLDEIEVRLLKLETSEPKRELPSDLGKTEVASTPATAETHFPVPIDYVETLHTLLNSKFGIKVEPFSDRPQFSLTIVVPREYSSINDQEWKIAGGDFRSKVLNYADGINGVREWIQKVYDNFDPETKAKIKIAI